MFEFKGIGFLKRKKLVLILLKLLLLEQTRINKLSESFSSKARKLFYSSQVNLFFIEKIFFKGNPINE